MSEILIPVVIVLAIGLIAGLGLALASIIMAVPKDEKAEQIEEILPGANCGACGFSGCSGYALALSKGEAKVGACAPGGEKVASEVAKLLGVEAPTLEKQVAFVHCGGSYDNTSDSMIYQGIDSCFAAVMLHGGVGKCSYGCMGFGDCESACQFGAISVKNGLSSVDMSKCTACGQCVEACPKNLIHLITPKKLAIVKCENCNKGAITNKACKVGCIGCMRCVKSCEYGAVSVKNFLARVDRDKCTGCGKCVEACPKGCISLLS